MKFRYLWSILVIALLVAFIEVYSDEEVEGKIKTHYDVSGRPVHQSREAKGLHFVIGNVKLTDGRATININTSTGEGRQDVSFLNKETYRGFAYSLDTSNTNTYRVIPVSGTVCLVLSSASSDTATVYFKLEGE